MYGCLFEASQNGQTCFDPLFYHYGFPMEDIESTFIVGDAIKVSPVLEELDYIGPINVFFPPGNWVDLEDYEVLTVDNPEGEIKEIVSEKNFLIRKHLMPGAIVPL